MASSLKWGLVTPSTKRIAKPLRPESADECDAAWATVTDANAAELVGGGRMQRSRLGSLISSVVIHGNEEYGYMAVYLRLKGIVPPSTENMGRGMGAGRGGR